MRQKSQTLLQCEANWQLFAHTPKKPKDARHLARSVVTDPAMLRTVFDPVSKTNKFLNLLKFTKLATNRAADLDKLI